MPRVPQLIHRIPLPALLALPVLIYLAIPLIWRDRDIYIITGDEPHYLLIAESLTRDRDLRVLNNYQNETNPVQRKLGLRLYEPVALNSHLVGEYSNHGVGLPLIIALPYSLFGVTAARVFLALIAALWPFLIYKALLAITKSPQWSVLIALTLSIGLPFTAAANQIFPDLPAGMIVFWIAYQVLRKLSSERDDSRPWLTHSLAAVLIGFLPWLHLRFIAPALVVLAAYLYALLKQSRSQSGKQIWLFVVPLVFLLSLVALGVYNRIAFGNILGFYSRGSLSFGLKQVAMIFFGLHWDQSHGMFMQQPLFLVGLLGLVILWRENWRAAVLLGTLYISIIVPNSMHTAWYGGFSFFGRFGWSVAPLWIFPMAYFVRSLMLEKRTRLLTAICVSSVLLQIWFAVRWLPIDGFLLTRRFHFWSSRSFYEGTALLNYLPTFKNFDDYLKHPGNWVFVLLGIVLVMSGWLWHAGSRRLLRPIWISCLVIGIGAMLLLPPAVGSWKLTAMELPSKVGSIQDGSRVATEPEGRELVAYLPYVTLLSGVYEVMLEYESTEVVDAGFDIIYWPQMRVITDSPLPPSLANQGIYKSMFVVEENQSLKPPFEFRVKYGGKGTLKVKALTIRPVAFSRSPLLPNL
ncbi:MAG TPA: hypothetical protein VJT71_10185 [Pyrinomonadaceae bacterium]|nr:hypothetical protein [Pyrinomonadaceae bacterium]